MAELSNLWSILLWVLIIMGNSRRITGLPPTPEGPIQPPPNTPVNCPFPDRPDHGDFKFRLPSSNENKEFSLAPVGTRIMYTCDSFYHQNTISPFRECLSDGSWSGIQPQCVPECGTFVEDLPYHIINGQPLDIQKWPWQAGLYDLQTLSLFCGGSIISERWVLTAGHCLVVPGTITPRDKNTLGVFFGQSQPKVDPSNPNSVTRMISFLVVHPDFASGNADIGLLRLDAPITFSERMRPVCFPDPKTALLGIVNQTGLVSRWGMIDQGKHVLSQQLQVINATVVKCDSQINRNGLSFTIDDSMLCAGNDEEGGPCSGDAGNGLCFLTGSNDKRVYVVEGVVSQGSYNVCSTPGHYEIYTRLQKFVAWINTYAITVYASQ